MRKTWLLAMLTVSTIVAGCGGGGPGRTLYHGGEVPAGNVDIYRIAPGAAANAVFDFGYVITANVGGSYRLVWTGSASGAPRHFTGSVWTNGNFTSLAPGCLGSVCALESDDFVSTVHGVSAGNRIDWDTYADAGLDGLDFIVDTEPVYFGLFVDNAAYPGNVAFVSYSAQGQPIDASAGTIPFGLTTQ